MKTIVLLSPTCLLLKTTIFVISLQSIGFLPCPFATASRSSAFISRSPLTRSNGRHFVLAATEPLTKPVTATTIAESNPSTGISAPATPRSQPRRGLAQQLLNLALASPLWKHVLVPQARASIVKTAEENGIPWVAAKEWLQSQKDAPWNDPAIHGKYNNYKYPEYYKKSFHAYSEGNLSYDAALEQELASRAVGARNFPKFQSRGEDVFRGAFDRALAELGARVGSSQSTSGSPDNDDVVVVDFGCGTGTSTRRLAKQFPQATQLIGIDLSPYFIDVGQTLLKLAPSSIAENGDAGKGDSSLSGWITTIEPDPRIQLRQGDIADTKLPSNSVAAVNLSLVIHELPTSATKKIILEAYRILRPGGQLWISEMDFESPAYKAQRENALLFSLLRATEPFLDEYADGAAELRKFIAGVFGKEGGSVKVAAATGRHYALLGEKGFGDTEETNKKQVVLEDLRFLDDGSYAVEDTHLKPWESKQDS